MKFIFFLMIIALFAACNTEKTDLSKETAEQIYAADTAMSNLATRDGFYKALIAYAEDSVIIPRPDKAPMIGRGEVSKSWAEKPAIRELTWKPIRAEASQSGDMGYTFGYAIYRGADTTTYTNYCTIWKKQKDGSWKFVYDGGNNIPQPADTAFFK